MARRPLSKSNTIATTGSTNSNFASAALYQIDSNGNVNPHVEGIFLINPDTIEDTKSSNWTINSIPGTSDPILQWMNGGPRNISFEALITNDTKYYLPYKPNPLGALQGQALSAVGSIASSFAGINVPIGAFLGAFNPDEVFPITKLDISRNLDYYRSLLYPTYDKNKVLIGSPPLLILYSNTSLGLNFGSNTTGTIDPTNDFWVLTDLNIKIIKQNPDLTPLEATVGFKLLQYRIQNRNYTEFNF